jgi:DNA-binding response OmpR family regulator
VSSSSDQRIIQALAAERDELREKVRQLELLVRADPGSASDYSIAFGLTRRQACVLDAIMRRERASHAQIEAAAWSRDAPPGASNTVSSVMSKTRSKMRGFDVEIHTWWGGGYFMTASMKLRVVELIKTWRNRGGAPARPVSGMQMRHRESP